MRDYVDIDALKKTLTLTNTTYADDDIALAVQAASRAIDNATGRVFYQDGTEDAPAMRYYTADGGGILRIDDLTTLAVVDTDPNGDGSFPTAWVLNTDYTLEPLNAPARGWPYEFVRLRFGGNQRFSPYYTRSVRVSGVFGWPSVPDEIVQATKILATRLLTRSRSAPFGIVTVGVDEPSAMRISRSDPDVMPLIQPYTRASLLY